MFSKAYQVVKNFTRPVTLAWRTADGSVSASLATFIVVNKDGWIITAAHILETGNLRAQHATKIEEYERRRAEIAADASLSKSQRQKQNSRLVRDPSWITHNSLWWCQDGVTIGELYVDAAADMAIARLDKFDASSITIFPKFNDPAKDPAPACSLCRLGFPFVEVRAIFDPATGFSLQNFTLPPMFPNDGIHTRMMHDNSSGRDIKFVETSTPGLKGQSGGPLFDASGSIWGIQARTAFLELGFTPKKKEGNKEIVEHQFMNVGLAGHVQHAIALFDSHGVAYEKA